MPSCQFGNCLLQSRFEMHAQKRSSSGGLSRAGPIQREFEDGGHSLESVPPEVQLSCDE
ncbi:Uncharacterised protein [Mycobacteroides abscessus subsp. abscessus]|nr:Uncharacterised protein [Mycobacteroides abscessus subsp. abscessus]